jgi:hypothetical protein
MFHGEFLSSALGVPLQRSIKQNVACIYTEAKKADSNMPRIDWQT